MILNYGKIVLKSYMLNMCIALTAIPTTVRFRIYTVIIIARSLANQEPQDMTMRSLCL